MRARGFSHRAVLGPILLVVGLSPVISGCAERRDASSSPIQPDQLRQALESRQFHDNLGTEEFVILRQYPYRVVIETIDGRQRIWEMVYMINGGWRLKGPDERLELVPDRGYRPPEG